MENSAKRHSGRQHNQLPGDYSRPERFCTPLPTSVRSKDTPFLTPLHAKVPVADRAVDERRGQALGESDGFARRPDGTS